MKFPEILVGFPEIFILDKSFKGFAVAFAALASGFVLTFCFVIPPKAESWEEEEELGDPASGRVTKQGDEEMFVQTTFRYSLKASCYGLRFHRPASGRTVCFGVIKNHTPAA